MITGASKNNIDILMDAKVNFRTNKSSLIYCKFIEIPHVIYAVNKMDLIDYDETEFNKIKQDLKKLVQTLL